MRYRVPIRQEFDKSTDSDSGRVVNNYGSSQSARSDDSSYFGSSSGRSAGSDPDRSVSSYGASTSDERRDSDTFETPFSDDAPSDVSVSNDSWFGKFFNWLSSRGDKYEGSSFLQRTGRAFGGLSALLAGAVGLSKLPALFGLLGRGKSSQSSADAAAIAALNDAGANISGSSSSSSGYNWLSSLFGNSSQSVNLGGVISGLTGIGAEFGSSILNYQNQLKLIDKQNEYNTPANQMQRFADAGLNPNLVYGLGTNGNQPASGSIAPVDFATAQRESKMQMLSYKADLAQKQANIRLMNANANEADERTRAQSLANSVYLQGWFNQQYQTLTAISQIANSINNDNLRVQIERDLADARVALETFQAQPEYMKKLGSVEDAMGWFEGFLQKISDRLKDKSMSYSDSDGVTHSQSLDGKWRGVGSTF